MKFVYVEERFGHLDILEQEGSGIAFVTINIAVVGKTKARFWIKILQQCHIGRQANNEVKQLNFQALGSQRLGPSFTLQKFSYIKNVLHR